MSWLSDIWKGEKRETVSVPSLSAEQRALSKVLGPYLTGMVGKPAAAYPGQLPGTADVPELFSQAYDWYADQFGAGDVSSAISDLVSGKPAYTFDPKETIKTWEETYASPIMETWKSTIAPILESEYNIPGAFYSTRKGMGIGRAAGEFYGGQVAPTLYSSLQAGEQRGFESTEAAAARQPSALGLPGQQFAQAAQVAMAKMGLDERQLTAAFNEFLRTSPEASPWMQSQLAYLGTPMVDTFAYDKYPGLIEQIISGGAQGAGAYGMYALMGGGA